MAKIKGTMAINNLKFLFNSNPPYVIYHVTDMCNMDCTHCFKHFDKRTESKDLSIDEVAKVSTRLSHVKYLTIGGGEPFVRNDIAEIAGIFYRNNDLHILNIVTNGWFTRKTVDTVKEILEACPTLTVSVGVSVDGPKELHDNLRRSPGSFERAISTISGLKRLAQNTGQRRLFVFACGTYHVENAYHILSTTEFLWSSCGVTYHVGLIRGTVSDNKLKQIDIDHFRKVSKTLLRLAEKRLPYSYPFRNLRIAIEDMVLDVIYNSVKKNKQVVKCMAARKGLIIASNGDIPLCELIDVNLGNLRQAGYDPVKLIRSDKAMYEIEKVIKQRCHCTWECFQRMNIVFSPSKYPMLAIKAARSYLRTALLSQERQSKKYL